MDRDLESIQEVRDLIRQAKEAQVKLREFPQKKLDDICRAIAGAGGGNRLWGVAG